MAKKMKPIKPSKGRKPSIKSLEKKLWDLTKEYVFARDRSRCQKCGKKVSGSNRHPSHVFSKKNYKYLRYDPLNLKTLCFHCHINWWHLNPVESGLWFKNTFPERYVYLLRNKHKTINEERRKQGLTLREWYELKIKEIDK